MSITKTGNTANTPAVRTFASVVDGLRISAAAKRELLELHDREVTAERDAAEARCLAPGLTDDLRDLVRGVVAVTRAETLRDVAQELQRFGTDAERAAAEDAHRARLALAHSFQSVPAALSLAIVDEREKALRELRAAEMLPPDDPDRRVTYGPCPLGSLAKRAREGSIEVTHEKETDR